MLLFVFFFFVWVFFRCVVFCFVCYFFFLECESFCIVLCHRRKDRFGACRGFWGFSGVAAGVLLPLASVLDGCTHEIDSKSEALGGPRGVFTSWVFSRLLWVEFSILCTSFLLTVTQNWLLHSQVLCLPLPSREPASAASGRAGRGGPCVPPSEISHTFNKEQSRLLSLLGLCGKTDWRYH